MAVDLRKFERGNYLIPGVYGSTYTARLDAYVYGIVSQESDPRLVPHYALEQMSYHPTVYLAERIVGGVVRRPDLYTVKHEDPRVVAEVEEWLWPLLPQLLGAALRGYSYGAVPVIFDWDRATINTRVPSGDGMRNRRLQGHTHYASAHEVRPSECVIEVERDELKALRYFGLEYDVDRVHVFKWDPHFGEWGGQGARRRAWRDYCTIQILDQLECAYLERSVDSPRVARAPAGTFEVDGTEYSTPEYVNKLLDELKGGGAITFPSTRDASGNLLYELEQLDLPDRSSVWLQAIGRREQRVLASYLALVGDVGSAAQAKTMDGLLKEFVQDLAVWVAENLTQIVEKVHNVNHNAERVRPPEIVATDVGKREALRVLMEALKMASSKVARHIDVAASLDRLGVPLLEQPDEPEQPPPGVPGRPIDLMGDREDRRDDARTHEGEEDTGQRGGRENGEELRAVKDQLVRLEAHLSAGDRQPVINNYVQPPAVHLNSPTQIDVHVPEQESPTILVENNVEVPELAQPTVIVEAPAQEPPVVHVEGPTVNVEAPSVQVDVNPELKLPPRTIKVHRDNKGRVDELEAE